MTDVHLQSSRYHQLTMERFHAMVAGLEFSRLQGLWLGAIGRETPFENLDDWVDEESQWRERDPTSWDALQLDVTGLSQAYGITRWHVLWSIFVRDYDPTLQYLVAHPDFLSHRTKCLEAFGLRSPFPNSDVFRRWHCQDPGRVPKGWKAVGAQVSSLAHELEARPMQMLKALLIQNYDPLGPTSLLFPLDAWDPKPRLVVLGPIPAVLEDLVRLGCRKGMYVEYQGSSPQDESIVESRGNFRISLEIPLEYPPDLAVQAARWALRTGRDMLRSVGFSQKQRVHKSNLVSSVKSTLKGRDCKPDLLGVLRSHGQQEGPLEIEFEGGNASGSDAQVDTPLSAVRLQLEFPPDVGSEDLIKATRLAIREARKALKSAGFDLGERLRVAPTVSQARALRVDGRRLAPGGPGDLIEDQTGGIIGDPAHRMPQAQKLKMTFKSRRGKVQKRLRRKELLTPK